MKKVFNLLLIAIFSLALSQQTSGTANDKDLVKLQTWLKGLGQKYTIKELKALTQLDLENNQLKTLPRELGNLKALTYLRFI